MPVVAMLFGALLTALGLWGRFATDKGGASVTSLIPAFVGLPLIFLGLLALKESMLKHAMHAAAALGLIGFLAAGARLIVVLVKSGKVEGPGPTSTAIMTGLCGVFVLLCVNSFLAARRRRKAHAEAGAPLPTP